MLNIESTNNMLESSENNFFMQNKKYIIGILSLILIILIIVIILLYKNLKTANNTNSSTIPTPLPLPTRIVNPIIPTSPPTPIPQPDDIIIDGIAVNNFKETPIRSENNNLVLAETTEYQILFNELEQKFILMILGNNFNSSQRNAEQRFLEILGIDKLNVCRLSIEEQVPSSVQNEHAGKFYPLSLCLHENDS